MEPSNRVDPPAFISRDNNEEVVENQPFIRGGEPKSDVRASSPRRPQRPATSSRIGSGKGKAATSSFAQVLSPLEDTLHSRKKAFMLLVSTLLVALIIMVSVKHRAVDIEKDVGKGDHAVSHHANPDLIPSPKEVEQEASAAASPHASVEEPAEKPAEELVSVPSDKPVDEPANEPANEPAANDSATLAPAEEIFNKIDSDPAVLDTTPTDYHEIDLSGYKVQGPPRKPTFYLPGTENTVPGSATGGRIEDYPITNHFQHRNPTSPTAKTWGWFDFEDPDPLWRGKPRPQPDFDSAENRDVMVADFPDGAWQKDDAYMKRFLEEARKLVNRTMESIYAEYGVGIPPDGSVQLTDEQLVQREEFSPFVIIDDLENEPPTKIEAQGKQWTTRQSLDGFARRLIHAIMTGDTFNMVMGGHSAAAGHGNNFVQSYFIKAGETLEPVFAHLGVELSAFNLAQGGMGTFQQALAGMDLRGKHTDFIMWDSSMTEKSGQLFVFFMKQALISGNRAPFLFGDGRGMRDFHAIGAGVGEHGGGWNGPITVDEVQALQVPWAARYLNCERENQAICKQHEYDSGCWVDRDDYTPVTPQDAQVGGRASWHPGNRVHKIRGRRIALFVLRGLDYALQKWAELTAESGHPLAEEHWHVTEYYKDIKEKAPSVPGCYTDETFPIGKKRRRGLRTGGNTTADFHGRQLDIEGSWPARLCDIPLQGRSLWGPRANPVETSLVSILKPNPKGDRDPNPNPAYTEEPVYLPPEKMMPWDTPPGNEVNVKQIAGARRLDVSGHNRHLQRSQKELMLMKSKIEADHRHRHDIAEINNSSRHLAEEIVPGYGISVDWGRTGVCDGTSHHWCDKKDSNKCLLGGTQDNRGMICIDSLSGWLVFEIKNVKHGFIGARIQAWHKNQAWMTEGWTEVNNGGNGNYDQRDRALLAKKSSERNAEFIAQMEREIEEDILIEDPKQRRLGGGQSCGVAGDYTFEFAINGEIKASWNKDQFCQHYTRLAYNFDAIKFMDDESQTGDFELAIRLKTGGGREQTTCISHIYWA
mmetsp:Transcript_7379/g.15793  ORF Transcript_7379/g.15793 Transcript_7379/m.15793 type:complete len:1042 (+) Transcript_7379:87-3212(+)